MTWCVRGLCRWLLRSPGMGLGLVVGAVQVLLYFFAWVYDVVDVGFVVRIHSIKP